MLEQIGPYKLAHELGHGGMGEVYLARDTRLDRPVAIKALPEHLAADPDRLVRFEREAKTLAQLNHPNVGGIFGIEEHGGRRYLVLEYVAGQSLAERLKDGPLTPEEALPIARQMAEALEAAHDKGIVHRDIKPANVMVTDEGRVKVLDFGLARTAEGPQSSSRLGAVTESPTQTTPMPVHSPTIPGAIMGTAGYMSPEQARGKPVDKRSDIFSFGCVLYEMLSGRQPFVGETVTDSLGAILHREPEWSLLPPGTPPIVLHLLRRCLMKDRHRRLHDIADARVELEQAIADPVGSSTGFVAAAPSAKGPLWRSAVILGAAGLLLLASGWMLASLAAPRAAAPSGPIMLSIPSRTSAYERAGGAVISPDGRSVVFTARAVDSGKWSLWIRPLSSFEAKPLGETVNGGSPFWSWDSRSIAFHADGKLWSVDVAQGGSRRLIAAEPGNYGASWGPNGDILLSRVQGSAEIIRIPAAGGSPERLATLDPKAFERVLVFPAFLPDGQRYLFVGVKFDPDEEVRVGQLYAGRLGSTERTPITNMISRMWYVEPGWLVYVEDGTIKAAPFDQQSLRITGDSVTVTDGAFYFKAYGEASVSLSAGGVITFEPPGEQDELVWFDGAGTRLGTIGPKGSFGTPRISPDGSQVAVGVGDRRTGASDLWLYGTGRPTSTRLTSDARWEDAPLWSRDGSTLYFSWDRSDAPWIYSISADGTGPIEEVYGRDSGGSVWFAADMAPDGTALLVNGAVEKLGRDLRIRPIGGKGEAVPFRSTPAEERNGRFSPDGKWVAYESTESGQSEVYLAPYPGAGPKVQMSEGGGSRPVWSPAGDRLYYRRALSAEDVPAGARGAASALMAVDLDKPESFKSPPPPRQLFQTAERIDDIDIAPDGKRFLLHLAPVDTPPIRVILNGLPTRP